MSNNSPSLEEILRRLQESKVSKFEDNSVTCWVPGTESASTTYDDAHSGNNLITRNAAAPPASDLPPIPRPKS